MFVVPIGPDSGLRKFTYNDGDGSIDHMFTNPHGLLILAVGFTFLPTLAFLLFCKMPSHSRLLKSGSCKYNHSLTPEIRGSVASIYISYFLL